MNSRSERLFAYERWANRRLLTHLRNLKPAPKEACRLFAHVLAGLSVWLLRLEGEDSAAEEIWPSATLHECEVRLGELETKMTALVHRCAPECLEREVEYTNQHGLSYQTSVGDILTHLGCHGAYHRGQIALCLRQAGLEPVNTDYITFVREVAGQPWKP